MVVGGFIWSYADFALETVIPLNSFDPELWKEMLYDEKTQMLIWQKPNVLFIYFLLLTWKCKETAL